MIKMVWVSVDEYIGAARTTISIGSEYQDRLCRIAVREDKLAQLEKKFQKAPIAEADKILNG